MCIYVFINVLLKGLFSFCDKRNGIMDIFLVVDVGGSMELWRYGEAFLERCFLVCFVRYKEGF